ncbi:MAG: hypothetical protein WCB58_21485 [Acidobacteriaceae bacterium]
MNPVPTPGGSSYNVGADHRAGAFDQRGLEMRDDILVYTTEPLANNFDEKQGVVAHNQVHHSPAYPSSITLSVVKQ